MNTKPRTVVDQQLTKQLNDVHVPQDILLEARGIINRIAKAIYT